MSVMTNAKAMMPQTERNSRAWNLSIQVADVSGGLLAIEERTRCRPQPGPHQTEEEGTGNPRCYQESADAKANHEREFLEEIFH